jgi:hypothetical protein
VPTTINSGDFSEGKREGMFDSQQSAFLYGTPFMVEAVLPATIAVFCLHEKQNINNMNGNLKDFMRLQLKKIIELCIEFCKFIAPSL